MEQSSSQNAPNVRATYAKDEDMFHQLVARQAELIDARKQAYRSLQGTSRLDRVADIDAELKTLKPRIAITKAQLQNSETDLRAQASTRFSDDIWRHIFDLATSASVDLEGFILPGKPVVLYGAGAPYALASVCRAWRALVLATPSLWANFHSSALSFKSREARRWTHVLAALQLQLERSGMSPLNVTIDLQRGNENVRRVPGDVAAARTIFDVLAGHARRWQHIDFNLVNNNPTCVLESAAACLAAADAPILRTLRVVVMKVDWRSSFTTPTALPRGSSLLHELTVEGNRITTLPTGSLNALATLHVKLSGWKVEELWDVLRAAPLLEILKLSGWSERLDAPTTTATPLPCAKLRSLDVSAAGMRFIWKLIKHIDLSHVQRLVVRAPETFNWQDLVEGDLLQSLRESVTTLIVRKAETRGLGEKWARQFGALPLVREFHDEDGGTRNDFWETIDEENLWPKLEVIHSTTRPDMKIPITRLPALEALGDMIAHRNQGKGQGISKVRKVYVNAEEDTQEWLAGLVAQ